MGLKANFSLQDIRKDFALVTAQFDAAVIITLSYLGEMGVIQARSLNTYQDQTGNLRSSVGYLILRNGLVVKSAFTGGKAQGRSEGNAVARQLAAQFPTGYALIVVAGMNYAATVESRGLDVLTSAQLLAEREMPGLIEQLKSKINTFTR